MPRCPLGRLAGCHLSRPWEEGSSLFPASGTPRPLAPGSTLRVAIRVRTRYRHRPQDPGGGRGTEWGPEANAPRAAAPCGRVHLLRASPTAAPGLLGPSPPSTAATRPLDSSCSGALTGPGPQASGTAGARRRGAASGGEGRAGRPGPARREPGATQTRGGRTRANKGRATPPAAPQLRGSRAGSTTHPSWGARAGSGLRRAGSSAAPAALRAPGGRP